MAEERTQRRLAAILAADVAGYSRLMEQDEAGTLAALKQRRKGILQPLVAEHSGRIVKVMGDGVLVEFASAVNAVTCAVELQKRMALANASLSDDRHIVLRIGINLGDVMVEGSDLYGDGVNVAARLESTAEPGSILISGTTYDHVKNKVEVGFDDVGTQTLKNIAERVRVYRITGTPVVRTTHEATTEKSSIAVLPFANMSGNPEQDYFADGITEDLITALAKSDFLSVVARNSTFQFKNRSVDVQSVGRQLGARFVLEGSVRTGPSRIRVTAQLIEAKTGMHLWAERFDRELSDVFAVQDEIVAAISGQLAYNLIDAAADVRRIAPTKSLTAYDYLLRGRASWRRGAVIETMEHYTKAAEADPQYAAALASLVFFYSEDTWMQMTGKTIDELAKSAREHVDRAIAANKGDSFVHHMVGTGLLNLGDLDRAKHHLETAISLNPHFPSSAINLGCLIAFMGRHREGLAVTEKAFGLEPRLPPAMRAVPFYIHCVMGDPDGALKDLDRIENPFAFLHLFAAGCLAQAEREQDARRHTAAFEDKRPSWFDIPGFARVICNCLRMPEDRQRFVDGLRKAGLLS